jgi:predicted nucleotidyltransferase
VNAEDTLQALATALSAEPDIIAAVVFGSVVRGTARADSDLDLAVLFRDDNPREARARELVEVLGHLSFAAGRTVHLVDLAQADSALRRTVFATGALLFDRSEGALRILEHRNAIEYVDWAHARAVIDAGHRRQLGLARG